MYGGFNGFDKKIKEHELVQNGSECILILTLLSPDGDGGYSGNLQVKVDYIYNDNNELTIRYQAITDKPTFVNLTNHAYFNVSGKQGTDTYNHRLIIKSDRITTSDETYIPAGKYLTIEGTNLDFNQERLVGEALKLGNLLLQNSHGFDLNYVLNDHP